MSREIQERLINILRRFADQRMVILGDAIADRFLYGSISRVSREAPVFILKHQETRTVPGGAANCAMNMVALGAQVSLVSVTGADGAGEDLHVQLKSAGVNVEGVITSEKIQTTTKVRILAGQSHSNKQQVIRIDYEGPQLDDAELRATLLRTLEKSISNASAVVISDYNYGVVNPETIKSIRQAAAKIPVVVDSRFRLSEWTGFTAATPNQEELENLAASTTIDSLEKLENVATRTKQWLEHHALLVTRGPQGMMLLEDDEPPLHIPAVGAQQAVDVTGAGDTVIATFALALASGASFADAARLANYAGGLVVMKRGTATISQNELEHSILHS